MSLDEIEKPPELENYYDQAIITGKSKDTSNLCKIANFFTKGPVLSLQNGIGNLEILHDYFFEKSAVGVTTNAVTKIEPGRIIWVSKGKLEISGNAGQEFVSSLNCLSPEFFVKPDEILWNKLLINVAINPIAAMCGVRLSLIHI